MLLIVDQATLTSTLYGVLCEVLGEAARKEWPGRSSSWKGKNRRGRAGERTREKELYNKDVYCCLHRPCRYLASRNPYTSCPVQQQLLARY